MFLQEILYRDLKLSNILLDKYHRPKICDKGRVDRDETLYLGDAKYTAPEKYNGAMKKSEYYSFGLIAVGGTHTRSVTHQRFHCGRARIDRVDSGFRMGSADDFCLFPVVQKLLCGLRDLTEDALTPTRDYEQIIYEAEDFF